MKVVYNKIIPFPGYKCVNIFGILFTRSKLKLTDYTHESIHTE